MRSVSLCGLLILVACFARIEAWAQDTAAEEATRRALVIAQLPPGAAKMLFGLEGTPAAGPPQAIGSYERGCLSGAIALPPDGPGARAQGEVGPLPGQALLVCSAESL